MPQIAQTSCDTGLQPSRVPGQIGTLKSKVEVWENDPFWARPHQTTSWSFTENMALQIKETGPTAWFELGSAFLRPIFRPHDMFVCTINPKKSAEDIANGLQSNASENKPVTVALGVDFVGSSESGVGQIAQNKMPGGKIYRCNAGQEDTRVSDPDENPCFIGEAPVGPPAPGQLIEDQLTDPDTGKDIFPHQVWKHVGSLFSDEVLIHPSEYGVPFSQLGAVEASFADEVDNIKNKKLLDKLQAAAQWDYIENIVNGKAAIWPQMTTKHSPDLNNSVHWTLEKWTPVWQGQDFFVSIKLGDKETDDARDSGTGGPMVLSSNYNPYLNYDIGNLELFLAQEIIPGITNEAFYIPPTKAVLAAVPLRDITAGELNEEAMRQSRDIFDWRFKTYILIEVGVNDPQHNYFIELVKGRPPRFLHLGEEWDHAKRLEEGFSLEESSKKMDGGFAFHKKCRELSFYPNISSEQLFKQDFAFSVRNHLGRLVITFQGYENAPWVIERRDNDPTKRDFSKILVPMVIPSALVRIHGGNISCSVNYSPTRYAPSTVFVFPDRQVDTGPNNEDKADNGDVFMTFSHIGHAVQYKNPNIKETYFKDPRQNLSTVGFDCDAYTVGEIIQNRLINIPIYELFDKQFKTYGKGYYNISPREKVSRVGDVKRDRDTQLPLPPEFKNAMRSGGVPSTISFINAENPTASSFPLGLNDPKNKNYQWKDSVSIWHVGVVLTAGSVKIDPPTGVEVSPTGDNPDPKLFTNYITPIATSWSLTVLGGGKPFEKLTTSFNISPLVSSISDSWSAEDFTSLSHEMQMECYIPIESTGATNPEDVKDVDLINLFNLGRNLLALHDKTFYMTISYWWEKGIGHRYVESNSLNEPGQDPNKNDILIQMTGMAYGGQLTRSNNRLIMSFTVKDYMSVLENQFIFNSPFFDAVQDIHAIYELARMAGFADETDAIIGVDRRPLAYLRKVITEGDTIGERLFTFNGEKSRSERYDLPGTYSTFVDPKVKFQNGETYESAIKRIAQLGGKTVYFDRWGVLRVETPAALAAAFSAASDNLKLDLTPVFDFVSTPIVRSGNIPSAGGEAENDNFVFNPNEHAAHLVYNSVTYQRSVEECSNQILIMSASKDIKRPDGSRTGGFIYEGYAFYDQMHNPEAEGFIGYRKPMYQEEGAFGSIEGVRNAISIYAKKKFPPVILNFETYGVPGLKALDIITLDGNLGYITEISHELDPAENRWWMNITAEWLKPIKGELGFLASAEPATGKSDK